MGILNGIHYRAEEKDKEKRGQQALVSRRGWKGTGGLCASGLSEDHQRCDPPGRGKRHSQERRVWKEDRWNQEWMGMGQDGERRKTYSAAVIEGFKRNSAIYVGDSIVRKTDSRLHKGEDVVVCLPGARIEHVTERVEKIMGRGKGGTILVHIGTNNADKEGTTAIVDKYRKLLKKTKEARVEQIILSGIQPVFGNRIDGYRNSKRMAINGMVKRLCKEEDVGYVDQLCGERRNVREGRYAP